MLKTIILYRTQITEIAFLSIYQEKHENILQIRFFLLEKWCFFLMFFPNWKIEYKRYSSNFKLTLCFFPSVLFLVLFGLLPKILLFHSLHLGSFGQFVNFFSFIFCFSFLHYCQKLKMLFITMRCFWLLYTENHKNSTFFSIFRANTEKQNEQKEL